VWRYRTATVAAAEGRKVSFEISAKDDLESDRQRHPRPFRARYQQMDRASQGKGNEVEGREIGRVNTWAHRDCQRAQYALDCMSGPHCGMPARPESANALVWGDLCQGLS
jgi:hypothetical protein